LFEQNLTWQQTAQSGAAIPFVVAIGVGCKHNGVAY